MFGWQNLAAKVWLEKVWLEKFGRKIWVRQLWSHIARGQETLALPLSCLAVWLFGLQTLLANRLPGQKASLAKKKLLGLEASWPAPWKDAQDAFGGKCWPTFCVFLPNVLDYKCEISQKEEEQQQLVNYWPEEVARERERECCRRNTSSFVRELVLLACSRMPPRRDTGQPAS